MRRTRFDDAACPIARTTDLLGDWWTPLVLREAYAGVRRFDVIQRHLGIPRATLASRLDRLVTEGLLRRERYQDHPPRDEYRLTRKGAELYPVLAAMFRWGSDWLFDDAATPTDGSAPPSGTTLVLVDSETGEEIRPLVVDERTGRPIDVRRTRVTTREQLQGATG